MLGSPSSSRRALLALTAVALALTAGCASVRPEDKELLAEPAMTWGGEGGGQLVREHDAHVIDNREASFGGGNKSGGGCGCN